MIKEIEIKGVKPKKKLPTDIVDSLPVGSTVNGVTKAKKFTDYDEKNEEQELEETRKYLLTDDCMITKEQEEELKEKFIQEKTDEIMNAIKELSKGYTPKENIESSKKISDEDMFDVARKIFGIEKHPGRLEKFNKFVQACQKVAEERETAKQGLPKEFVDTFKEPVKQEYVAPVCKVKVVDGVIKFDDNVKVDKIVPEMMRHGYFDGILDEIKDLHARKNNDYGNAAHESFKEFGIISYVIRLNDKMKRLKSLTKPGAEQQVADEKIEDTLMDLAAYAIMAIESLRKS